jgi:hypothetical protein
MVDNTTLDSMNALELDNLIALVRSTESGSTMSGAEIDALWTRLGGRPNTHDLMERLRLARQRQQEAGA